MPSLLSCLRCFTRLIFLWLGLNSIIFANDEYIGFALFDYNATPPLRVTGQATLPRQGTIELPIAPTSVKQTVLSRKTTNPFRVMYAHLYEPAFLKQLQTCPFLGMSYELDGNPTTKEWFVATLFYGCIKQYNNYMSAQSHNWILQQDAKKGWKVLMESDGRNGIVVMKSQSNLKGYDKLITDHYVVNFAPTAKPPCGSKRVEWVYHQNHYQIVKHGTGINNCDGLFKFGSQFVDMLPQEALDKNEAKAQKAVELITNPWLKQLRAVR